MQPLAAPQPLICLEGLVDLTVSCRGQRARKGAQMSPEIHGEQIALRLLLTVLAGGLLGMERSRTGHPAGLRTTLLVTLAASVAMIQMNLLMQSNGKPSDSFAVMDLMRLPLGILTGVGFIGAGAIVRKNELVLGITTAATLWYATVVGLCLGGGQLLLGSISAFIGYLVLWGLRRFESRFERYQLAELRVSIAAHAMSAQQLRARLHDEKFKIKSFSVYHSVRDECNTFHLQVRWPADEGKASIPPLLAELERLPGMVALEWNASGDGPH
jgi:putative Mg2+ transporter-C (MgtC) family protein